MSEIAHLRKLNKTIKVTIGTLRRLERLKRKFRVRAINDVIVKLLDSYEEYEVLKEMEKKRETTQIVAPQVPIEQNKEVSAQISENKCVYRSYNPKENIVYCAKDFADKGKIHKVTPEFCNTCWKLRQKEIKEEEERKRELELKLIKQNIHYLQEKIRKRIQEEEEKEKKAYFCVLKNQGFRDLKKLPCIENPMFTCPNKECHKKVLEMLK